MRTLLYSILIVTGCSMVSLTSLAQTVTRWSGTVTGASMAGQVILDGDVTMTGTVSVDAGQTLTLDLNGYCLSKTDATRFFVVAEGASLVIADSSPERTHSVTELTDIVGGVITGGTGDRGGCAFVSGTLVLQGGTIHSCTAVRQNPEKEVRPVHIRTEGCGGAVFINNNGSFRMVGGTIMNCSTGLTEEKKSLKDSQGTSHDIYGDGGAVYVDAEGAYTATFTMTGGTISGCTAGRGGGVYLHSTVDGAAGKSVFNFSGGTINGNTAWHYGCGVFSRGQMTMSGGVITENRPGGWTDWSYPSADVYPAVCQGNIYGGGIHLEGTSSLLTMTGGSISRNVAASGGGVMVYTGSSFIMQGADALITGNYAVGTGGLGNGGAVYVQTATFSFLQGTLTDNTAVRYGGAVNINQSAKFTINGDCKVTYNRAQHGGGLSQEAGECNMTLDNAGIAIEHNTAHGYNSEKKIQESGNGGGLFIEKGALVIGAGRITENTANGDGGGVSIRISRITGNVDFTMTGGTIADNVAGGAGGGIDLYADTESSLTGNDRNRIGVSLMGGKMLRNRAVDGGALHIDAAANNSDATMTVGAVGSAPDISNNIADRNGGAVAMTSGTVTIIDGVLNSNEAGGDGGDVNLANGSVIMSGGSITENTAVNGGGISIKNGTFTGNGVSASGFTVSGNNASYLGGALYVNNASSTKVAVTFDGGNLTDNSARAGGGVAVSGYVSLTTDKTSIFGNTAVNGGGIYMTGTSSANPAAMTFGQGMIYNNTATAEAALPDGTAWHGTETAVSGVGGGIFLDAWSSLSFDVNEVFGLYGNTAENAADDIFASGVGTKVVLPEVKDMNLTDFNIPAGELFWTEDYTENDTRYRDGLAGIATDINDPAHNLRYDYALYRLKRGHIAKVAAQTLTDTYTCLTLGYEIYLVTVERQGLKKGESAVFRIISSKQDPEAYIMLTLTGIDDTGTTVSRRLALPDGSWRVEEVTPWAWSYNHPDGAQSATTITDETVFRFTGSKREAVPMHHEGIDKAVMALPE